MELYIDGALKRELIGRNLRLVGFLFILILADRI